MKLSDYEVDTVSPKGELNRMPLNEAWALDDPEGTLIIYTKQVTQVTPTLLAELLNRENLKGEDVVELFAERVTKE